MKDILEKRIMSKAKNKTIRENKIERQAINQMKRAIIDSYSYEWLCA